MRNAGIREFLALRDKTVALIEADGMRLCIQLQLAIAAPARTVNQKFKDRAADTAPAPITPHRHPPDVAIRQQPAGADGLALRILRQRMHGNAVKLIPFQ